MARVIALVHIPQRQDVLSALRVTVVCSCAAALIAAGQALPFLHI